VETLVRCGNPSFAFAHLYTGPAAGRPSRAALAGSTSMVQSEVFIYVRYLQSGARQRARLTDDAATDDAATKCYTAAIAVD